MRFHSPSTSCLLSGQSLGMRGSHPQRQWDVGGRRGVQVYESLVQIQTLYSLHTVLQIHPLPCLSRLCRTYGWFPASLQYAEYLTLPSGPPCRPPHTHTHTFPLYTHGTMLVTGLLPGTHYFSKYMPEILKKVLPLLGLSKFHLSCP